MSDLYEAAKAFYNATIGDKSVTVRTYSADKQALVIAAADRLRKELQATPSPAVQTTCEKDAERYRWLKENIKRDHDLPGGFCLDDTGKTWDKTIDAAMKS